MVTRAAAQGSEIWVPRVILGLSLILAVTSLLLVLKVNGFAHDLRDNAVSGCQRQNYIRKQERDSRTQTIEGLQKQITQTRATHPSDFPNIPPGRFKQLVQRSINQFNRQIHNAEVQREHLKPTNCEKAYPS